jgi:predicted dehydrogenase
MKIGTVGTNFIVDRFAEAAKKTGEAEITAVYSRSAETAKAFAAKHGAAKTYTDRGAFLNDGGLDIIYVAAPNSLHYEWTRGALLAGKSVICEKPFVSKAAELEKLVEIARQKKLFLFEAVTVPHLPNFCLIREKLPAAGKVRVVQLNFSQYSSRYGAFLEGKTPNNFNPEYSGGALMDLNYYNLCFVQRLFGEPEEIRYFANTAANGVDISGVLVMKYQDFSACAVAAKDSDSKNYVQIQGEAGYIFSESTTSNLKDGFSVVAKAGINVMNPVTAKPIGSERFNAQDCENVLYYEMLDFIEIFKSGDFSRCETELDNSLVCARLMDRARRDAGIVFSADRVEPN